MKKKGLENLTLTDYSEGKRNRLKQRLTYSLRMDSRTETKRIVESEYCIDKQKAGSCEEPDIVKKFCI